MATENQPWKLYDIQADRSELNNLATNHPEKVNALFVKGCVSVRDWYEKDIREKAALPASWREGFGDG